MKYAELGTFSGLAGIAPNAFFAKNLLHLGERESNVENSATAGIRCRSRIRAKICDDDQKIVPASGGGSEEIIRHCFRGRDAFFTL